MNEFIIDMGFEEFSKKEELDFSLAYAIARGLRSKGRGELLCDFSDGGRTAGAEEILCLSLAMSRRVPSWSAKPRIGVVIPPGFAATICNYACVFAGRVPVNLNFTMGPVAAKSCLETSGADVIASSSKVREKISAANPKFPWTQAVVDIEGEIEKIPAAELERIRTLAGEDFGALLAEFGIEKNAPDPSEGTLVFTSGSEGAPKAVVLTQRNIIANCEQIRISEVFGDGDVLLANLPIFHSFGALFEVWYMGIAGQHTVSLNSPLDIKNNIRAIREKKASVMIGSPTFLRAYIKYATREDMRSLKKAIAGAEKTPEGFHEIWNKQFGENTYREGYGLTETTPVVGVNLDEKDFGWYSTGSRRGSIGKLFPGMQARILDPLTRQPMKIGAQGLLSLRGPNVFGGYLGRDDATREVFDGGWLVTGDLSRLDMDGFVYIDGRLSRFSKIGGEMVPHATVEGALARQLGLANAEEPMLAISSRLDDSKGEALVLISAVDVSLHEVKDALRAAGISNLWHPKHLVKADKIPLLPSGKLDLFEIGRLARK